jgi:trans-aconitate 2-methyltransferase
VTWAATPKAQGVDLVYSNAALHWLDDHAALFPRLLDAVALAGCWPCRCRPISTRIARRAARDRGERRWRARLEPLLRRAPVAPRRIFRVARPGYGRVDVWTTEYLHVLPRVADGEHPVVTWTRGTALTPFLVALDAEARRAFVADYAARIAAAYPVRADGRVLFAFRRLFIVATKKNR